jgi:hypothetical protein
LIKKQKCGAKAPHLIKSVLFGLKSRAYRIGAGRCKAGTNCNLFCSAVAIALVIGAVLHVAGNALIDGIVTAILVFHLNQSPFG